MKTTLPKRFQTKLKVCACSCNKSNNQTEFLFVVGLCLTWETPHTHTHTKRRWYLTGTRIKPAIERKKEKKKKHKYINEQKSTKLKHCNLLVAENRIAQWDLIALRTCVLKTCSYYQLSGYCAHSWQNSLHLFQLQKHRLHYSLSPQHQHFFHSCDFFLIFFLNFLLFAAFIESVCKSYLFIWSKKYWRQHSIRVDKNRTTIFFSTKFLNQRKVCVNEKNCVINTRNFAICW